MQINKDKIKYMNKSIKYMLIMSKDPNKAQEYLNKYTEEERKEIIMLSKEICADAAVKQGTEIGGDCNECKWCNSTEEEGFICCKNEIATVRGDETEDFNFPNNFKPEQIKYCDGFVENS